ncbi:hypothetical protein Tdes44962_MAKER08248 [Teratosphaeria destructans]|uniref:Uncharacterized protein n=1 Tax=Teratosphaeria destructans TaxID=418781 RepID=A0A9W7W4Q6_9PEZI|nr:hypothetical protein Tdes44962_MAKER08248 [Teratosphaeria destructans]
MANDKARVAARIQEERKRLDSKTSQIRRLEDAMARARLNIRSRPKSRASAEEEEVDGLSDGASRRSSVFSSTPGSKTHVTPSRERSRRSSLALKSDTHAILTRERSKIFDMLRAYDQAALSASILAVTNAIMTYKDSTMDQKEDDIVDPRRRLEERVRDRS